MRCGDHLRRCDDRTRRRVLDNGRGHWDVLRLHGELNLSGLGLLLLLRQRSSAQRRVVDEAAASAIGTSALGVEGFADLGFVLGMTHDNAQFILAMRKLTLVAVSASTSLGPRATKFSFVKRLLSKFIFNFDLLLLLHLREQTGLIGGSILLRALRAGSPRIRCGFDVHEFRLGSGLLLRGRGNCRYLDLLHCCHWGRYHIIPRRLIRDRNKIILLLIRHPRRFYRIYRSLLLHHFGLGLNLWFCCYWGPRVGEAINTGRWCCCLRPAALF